MKSFVWPELEIIRLSEVIITSSNEQGETSPDPIIPN